MTNGETIFRCTKGHEWIERTILPMAVRAWHQRITAMSHCPKCGRVRGTVLLLGDEFKAARLRLAPGTKT